MMRSMLKTDHPHRLAAGDRRRGAGTAAGRSRHRRRRRQIGDHHRRAGHAGPVARATASADRSPRSSPPTCARPACSRRSARAASAATATPRPRAPAYAEWRGAGASALVSGFVEQRGDGRLTRRLLCPRRHRRPRRSANQGFTVAAGRLAPGRAQMRRPRLFAAVGPRRLPRHPRRLCRRNRAQDQPHEAHRHHGFGRLQPPLSDRRARRR